MNKIKVLYDVLKTLKTKEVISGILTANIQKDQTTIFSLTNEFTKNVVTGQTKAKINTELDYEGKSVKHESATEFTVPFGKDRFHGGMPSRHHHGGRCGGVRGRFSKLVFALDFLNALEVQEQQKNTLVLSLESANLSDDVKELVRERLSHAGAHHARHGFMQEGCTIEQLDFTVTAFITKSYEIEKVLVTFAGIKQDEQQVQHEIKANAELVLQTEAGI